MLARLAVLRALAFAAAIGLSVVLTAAPTTRRAALLDESDRLAFQSWFTFLADTQFERASADVTDCASLIRHAYREALRSHTPEWHRRSRLPLDVGFPDVRSGPPVTGPAWLLFRVAEHPERFAEFADAATLIHLNARHIDRGGHAMQPGDLLYFRQEGSRSPDHLMIFVGESRFEPSGRDWVVYHTGPQDGGPGEMRKTSLADLRRHPSARWRPVRSNPAFAGVFRLSILDRSR